MSYRVSFSLDDEDVGVFLRNVAPKLDTVTIRYVEDKPFQETTVNTTHVTDPTPEPVKVRAKRKARKPLKKRGSKVNDTVLAAIGDGEAHIRDLKAALEGAGLKASSLSTALAFLQKSALIERTGDGVYRKTNQVWPAGSPEAVPAPEAA